MFHVERSSLFRQWITEGSAKLGITLTHTQIEQFYLYLNELLRWNKKINLTAIREEKDIVARHFLDSMICVRVLENNEEKKLIDVGSGAGFPGIPIKILFPCVPVYLVEPNQKKIAFLRHMIGTLQLKTCSTIGGPVQCLHENEEFTHSFSFLVTRALSIKKNSIYFNELLKEHGKIVLFRAFPSSPEQTINGFRIVRDISYEVPFISRTRYLTILEKCRH